MDKPSSVWAEDTKTLHHSGIKGAPQSVQTQAGAFRPLCKRRGLSASRPALSCAGCGRGSACADACPSASLTRRPPGTQALLRLMRGRRRRASSDPARILVRCLVLHVHGVSAAGDAHHHAGVDEKARNSGRGPGAEYRRSPPRRSQTTGEWVFRRLSFAFVGRVVQRRRPSPSPWCR